MLGGTTVDDIDLLVVYLLLDWYPSTDVIPWPLDLPVNTDFKGIVSGETAYAQGLLSFSIINFVIISLLLSEPTLDVERNDTTDRDSEPEDECRG